MEESKTVNVAHHVDDPNVGLPMTDKWDTFKMYVGDTGLFVTLAFADKEVTENIIYQKLLSDKLAGETGDEKLADIRDRMKTAFDGAVLDQVSFDLKVLPLLPSFSLSVVLVPHEGYTWQETYEHSVFHKKTGWGKWLDVNTCTPEGNPFGQGEET